MSRKLQQAAALAVAVMMVFTITNASGAFAQDDILETEQVAPAPLAQADTAEAAVRFIAQEVVQELPQAPQPADAATLPQLIASIPVEGKLSKDLHCLASAIYFEARGEELMGQLAVGEVIVNRAESGKFPASYCGVVYQRSQFSFVKGGRIPSINTSSSAWHNAQAIAMIAHEGLWDSPVQDALFFHATYVNPSWNRTRVARVDNHVFYR